MSDWLVYILAVGGGFLAGIINTLAGNGSMITLGILTELIGLPGNVANATNRVGILVQSVASSSAFAKEGALKFGENKTIIISTLMGAILGSIIAINISNDAFVNAYKVLMVLMFFVILVKPKRWLKETDIQFKLSNYISIPIFFSLGIYAGFIQMGMGILFLTCMVLFAKKSIIESNIIKLLVVCLLTIPVLSLFAIKGLVDWRVGAIMASGQGLGGYLTAKYIVHHPHANKIAYFMLIFVVLLVLIKMFTSSFL